MNLSAGLAGVKEKLKGALSSERFAYGAVAVILVGLLLICFARCGEGESPQSPEEDVSAYAESMEKRLADLLTQTAGVGDCRVMLTFEQSFEKVYVSGKSNLQTVRQPEIRGVAVICRGGRDTAVQARVRETVAVALGIGWDRVSVQAAE